MSSWGRFLSECFPQRSEIEYGFTSVWTTLGGQVVFLGRVLFKKKSKTNGSSMCTGRYLNYCWMLRLLHKYQRQLLFSINSLMLSQCSWEKDSLQTSQSRSMTSECVLFYVFSQFAFFWVGCSTQVTDKVLFVEFIPVTVIKKHFLNLLSNCSYWEW